MSILLVLGDSMTYGHWDRQGGWVQRLRAFLERRALESENYHELNTRNYVVVYNLGIPGDTTDGVLKRFDREVAPRLDAEQDNIILIAIGINDSHLVPETNDHNVTLERFSTNLRRLIHRSKKLTDKIFFVGLTLVDESRYPDFWPNPHVYKNAYIRKYDAEIKDVCTRYGLDFIDVLDVFSRSDYTSLLEDGIHLNDKGHELIEGIVREYLLQNGVI